MVLEGASEALTCRHPLRIVLRRLLHYHSLYRVSKEAIRTLAQVGPLVSSVCWFIDQWWVLSVLVYHFKLLVTTLVI